MQSFTNSSEPTPEEINAALHDFGFYHSPRDTQRMYAEKVNHGTLGYAGGVLDQPEEYWFDMATMFWLQKWVEVVKPMVRLKQEDVIARLKDGGKLDGSLGGNS